MTKDELHAMRKAGKDARRNRILALLADGEKRSDWIYARIPDYAPKTISCDLADMIRENMVVRVGLEKGNAIYAMYQGDIPAEVITELPEVENNVLMFMGYYKGKKPTGGRRHVLQHDREAA